MRDTVLVVDDDALLLAAIGRVLEGADAVPVLVSGAPEAVRALTGSAPPDVVVIDLDMRDGFLVLAQIECASDALVSIIALSSQPGRLLEAGIVDAVLAKPFGVGEIQACVRRAFDRPLGAC